MELKGLIFGLSVLSSSAFAAQTPTEGNPLSTAIWDTNNIPVCWEDFSSSTAQQRGWVSDAISNTWEAVSDVDFTGWGECTNSSGGIRIEVRDAGPYVLGLGNALDGLPNGMLLNFTFNNWSSSSCSANVKSCAEDTAVHEFGHALGFAHEQNRSDTPSSCTDAPQGTDGDLLFDSWDLYSVMNYCNPNWNGNGDLSDTDIAMVQRFYSDEVPHFDFVQIQNYWQPANIINLETGTLAATPGEDFWWSAHWSLEKEGDFYRIKNRWLGDTYLHIENGPLEAGDVPSGFLSSQWTLTKVDGVEDHLNGIVFKIQNRWKPEVFLHLENGVLEAGPAEPFWHSSRWILNGFNQ